MILSDDEITQRIESPANLLHRLKEGIAKSQHSHRNTPIPSIPPTADKLIDGLDDKLKLGSIKVKASVILSEVLDELKGRIPDIDKPERLARIATEMSKVVTAQEQRPDDNVQKPQFVIYAPQFVSENQFETMFVKD
jgi:hypothetical protein